MDTSEITAIAAYHTAFANLRSMTMSERPDDVEVSFVGNGGNSLMIEMTSEETRLITMVLEYVNGYLLLSYDVFAPTNPAFLSDFAYAVQFADRVFNIVRINKDYAQPSKRKA